MRCSTNYKIKQQKAKNYKVIKKSEWMNTKVLQTLQSLQGLQNVKKR